MDRKQSMVCVIHELKFDIPLPIEHDLNCPLCMHGALMKLESKVEELERRQKVLLEAIDIKLNY